MIVDWPTFHPDQPAQYRICAQGQFSPCWLDMLSGEWAIVETPTACPDITILVGRVVDQAGLMGVLNGLYGLGLGLLLVECVEIRSG